eukprot:SAG31_NODE_3137_length_4632_cov_3.575871_5_plen_80_part_00
MRALLLRPEIGSGGTFTPFNLRWLKFTKKLASIAVYVHCKKVASENYDTKFSKFSNAQETLVKLRVSIYNIIFIPSTAV